jgi:hypothetical protein
MALTLGPMPERVREAVARLIVERRPNPPEADERLNGLFLSGGPTGCDYLTADGNAWSWDAWDNTVARIDDGPQKIAVIAIAAKRIPELAEWLPRRPPAARDCPTCHGTGRLLPPWPRHLQCSDCHGLGWAPDDETVTRPHGKG